jgi:hypothetical protein
MRFADRLHRQRKRELQLGRGNCVSGIVRIFGVLMPDVQRRVPEQSLRNCFKCQQLLPS